jgi:hypothetical protein
MLDYHDSKPLEGLLHLKVLMRKKQASAKASANMLFKFILLGCGEGLPGYAYWGRYLTLSFGVEVEETTGQPSARGAGMGCLSERTGTMAHVKQVLTEFSKEKFSL